ncbi:MAG: endonuclease NucS [Phycisphaerales bacterium]|jgi:hypothetical protein|nr:endonuclease NucS [Phycisphaerales bacterium]
MAIELSMWRIDSGLLRVEPTSMDFEQRLEDLLARNISIASSDWIVIGRQVPTPWGKFIDLLCMDCQGNLIVLELKRNKTEREVVAQALDYGSYIRGIQADDIRQIFADYQKSVKPGVPASTIEEALGARFRGRRIPDELNSSHKLIIVAASLDAATERIVRYLADEYGVRIGVLFFRVFKDVEREYLTCAWLQDSDSAQSETTTPAATERVPFNGEFYVNFGESDHRSWEDAIKFGFVSAGHGPTWRDAMQRLKPGNRIWVNAPGSGYVGVGVVEESAVPIREFMVKNPEGREVPLIDAGIMCKGMADDADDPDLCEYVVRVRWIKTVPVSQAIWERGFFGNQNCVAEPKVPIWLYTIDRLKQKFDITT